MNRIVIAALVVFIVCLAVVFRSWYGLHCFEQRRQLSLTRYNNLPTETGDAVLDEVAFAGALVKETLRTTEYPMTVDPMLVYVSIYEEANYRDFSIAWLGMNIPIGVQVNTSDGSSAVTLFGDDDAGRLARSEGLAHEVVVPFPKDWNGISDIENIKRCRLLDTNASPVGVSVEVRTIKTARE